MSYFEMTNGSHAMAAYGGLRGFGAAGTDFNADAVWSDFLAGSSGNNAAGKRATQSIQAALNQLGYGPLTLTGVIDSALQGALKKFSGDNGFGSANWPTKPMVVKMEELLRAGESPGPNEPVASHKVGDEFIPGVDPTTGKSGLATAGMSTGMMIGIGALAVAGIGLLAVMAKKKKPGTGSTSASAKANRRRRRRHHGRR